MARRTGREARASGFVLSLWCAIVVIELIVTAFAATGFDEVADASPFGRAGTIVVSLAIAAVACVGAVCAWRGAPGPLRVLVAVLLFLGTGLLVLIALFFVIAADVTVILGFLLVPAAVFVGLIGAAVSRSMPSRVGR
ncbi:hypothetical protein [Actinoplanes aureus]|uniref:Uncharacterized protein n=1 Tax=Actinoplanes aureus TaxID=2792083 RepID=A0A931CMH8_9ACTN|nr:hypothetical protein [Actinoplanes aureus]MBG0569111.1 hypothetical protein [Actinoplanes aureus]